MKEKKEKIVEEKSKFQEALDKLNKQYGLGTILQLDNKITGDYDLISSGSIGFDYITLGIGGFAKGKLYELMSWEGAGKTSICGHATAECQKSGGKVVFIDGEHALDRKYLQALGVDTNKLFICQPNHGEMGFQVAMDMINSGDVDLVIIDSDSSLIPKKVLDGEAGDSAIGKKALLNSSVYPKLKSAISQNNVCAIVCSQYREKIGIMFGNPTTTQGGHALKFYSDCRIELSKSLAKDGDDVYGNTTKVKAIKNKMAPPYRKAEFEIIYGKGIDRVKEIIILLDEFEIIKKWGKTITHGEKKYDVEEFNILLNDNPKFFNSLKEEIINKINNTEIPIE